MAAGCIQADKLRSACKQFELAIDIEKLIREVRSAAHRFGTAWLVRHNIRHRSREERRRAPAPKRRTARARP
jgi:hypothetical protein